MTIVLHYGPPLYRPSYRRIETAVLGLIHLSQLFFFFFFCTFTCSHNRTKRVKKQCISARVRDNRYTLVSHVWHVVPRAPKMSNLTRDKSNFQRVIKSIAVLPLREKTVSRTRRDRVWHSRGRYIEKIVSVSYVLRWVASQPYTYCTKVVLDRTRRVITSYSASRAKCSPFKWYNVRSKT